MYDPDSYDAYSEFQRRDARELIPYMVSRMDWRQCRRILDFGCGSGFITKHILLPLVQEQTKVEPLFFGVDLSQQMIDFAQSKYNDPKVTYMAMDILRQDPPLLFPTFDKIFSSHVLHWIPDQEKAARRLFSLLHRHGDVGLYFIASAPVFSVYEAMGDNPRWNPYLSDVKSFIPKTHFSDNPSRDFRDLMSRAGFQVEESSTLTRSFTFESLETMIDAAMAANPFIHRIPIGMHEEYKGDFQRAFQPFVRPSADPRRPEAVAVDYQLLLIRAHKA